MPGEVSQTGAVIGLNAILGRVTVNALTTYLALCSSAPTDIALGNEISTTGYARQAVTWSAPAGDPSLSQNSASLIFGPFTGDAPLVTHCQLMEASTGGTIANMRWWWELDVAKDPAINESLEFAAAALVATLD